MYDALNVLMAMDIISKEKKEIRWIGLPVNSKQDLHKLEVTLPPSICFSFLFFPFLHSFVLFHFFHFISFLSFIHSFISFLSFYRSFISFLFFFHFISFLFICPFLHFFVHSTVEPFPYHSHIHTFTDGKRLVS